MGADEAAHLVDHVDLAVVGGGPVGVLAALAANRLGLGVAVFERETEVYPLPRAVGMDDEIQRAFHALGLGDQLRAMSTPLQGAEFVDVEGTRLNGFDFPEDFDWPLGHHPLVIYHQPEFEAVLRQNAIESGVELRLGTDVTSVGQDSDGAWVDATAPDGTELRQPASWVVAADGAASPTRKSLGVEFVDGGFDQEWLVVDVDVRADDLGLAPLAQQICDPLRPTTFIPGHGGRCRWELQLQPGEDPAAMSEPDRAWELLSPWITPADGTLARAAVYRFHATVAASMREGRIFLAGDAAHQMPPFMGQGLCSGARDAVNLTWKLALVAEGRARDRLLDSYDLERRPHSHEMVDYSADTGRLIDELSGRTPTTEDAADAGYGGMRAFPHLEGGFRSGEHDLTGRQLPQPRVDGQPLDALLGTFFTIVAREDVDVPLSVRERWDQVGASVAEVGDDAAFVPEGGSVIVRPDRYVAAVAGDSEELSLHTDELLGWLS